MYDDQRPEGFFRLVVHCTQFLKTHRRLLCSTVGLRIVTAGHSILQLLGVFRPQLRFLRADRVSGPGSLICHKDRDGGRRLENEGADEMT